MLSEPFIALMNYSNGHNSKGDNLDNIFFLKYGQVSNCMSKKS